MPSNLAIDDHLLAEAQKAGGHRTKRETVNAALAEYVQRRKQQDLIGLFGKVDYDPLTTTNANAAPKGNALKRTPLEQPSNEEILRCAQDDNCGGAIRCVESRLAKLSRGNARGVREEKEETCHPEGSFLPEGSLLVCLGGEEGDMFDRQVRNGSG